jgi:hypothetical protein
MNRDTRSRPLVTFTVVFLVVYAPIETWYSLPALWDPFYLVDFIGMCLLSMGVAQCWRRVTSMGLTWLVAGYAWEGANFWRALFGRIESIGSGGVLRLGLAELWFVVIGTVIALGALAWSVRLSMVKDESHPS